MCSETSTTAILLSLSNLYVPPVDKISTPRATRFLANSTIPDLSDTEIKARLIVMIFVNNIKGLD